MSHDNPARIEARDLVFQVEAARILERVSLTASEGELIGLIGPNGAGKSTLLRTLAGLLHQQEGSVTLAGRDMAGMRAKEIARAIALAPQAAPSVQGFTSLEVVLMGRYPHMGRFDIESDADRRVAREAMRLTETAQFEERAVSTLSGGERQRVIVARALAQQPRVLLLDEPTSNLDILHQMKVLDLVKGLVSRGITAIAAIHDLHLAARYCSRLVLLSGGRVLSEGTPGEVLTPANLEAAFHVRAIVYPDPLVGTLTLSLLGPADESPAPESSFRIHVVCGGGSGAHVLYALQRGGFKVTAGPLGAGDTDRTAADILGIEYVPIPAFGEIDDTAHGKHLAMVRAADGAIICNTPFGANNVRSLEALGSARRLICIEGEPLAARDFTGGRASTLYRALPVMKRCRDAREAATAFGALAEEAAREGDHAKANTPRQRAQHKNGQSL